MITLETYALVCSACGHIMLWSTHTVLTEHEHVGCVNCGRLIETKKKIQLGLPTAVKEK